MAIDTETKRKSVIGAGLPSISLMPKPDGSIGAIDRRRLADLYSLVSQTISQNFWIPDGRETVVSWVNDIRNSGQNWVQDKRESSSEWENDSRAPAQSWPSDTDSDTQWKEEEEII